MKWVPGTTRSSRPEILKKTVNYIKKIQNKEKEIEKAKKTEKYIKKLENKIKELEKELLKKKVNYIEELQKKIKELETSQTVIDRPPREPHSSPMDISEPEVVLDPTGASTMDVRTTSEAESVTPEEVGSAEEELLANLEEELLASGIPDFNSMEDFIQWLEL
jgi:predicted RNase H-like nuclease (RuvC/YqgF family)